MTRSLHISHTFSTRDRFEHMLRTLPLTGMLVRGLKMSHLFGSRTSGERNRKEREKYNISSI